MADRPVNATPEVQGITVINSMHVNGQLTSDESLAWQTTNYGALNDPPLSMPYPANVLGSSDLYQPLPNFGEQAGDIIFWDIFNPISQLPENWGTGQEQFTNGYNEHTSAVSGMTDYAKSSVIDTSDQIPTGDNYQTSKQIAFVGADAGRMTSTEDLLIDGAGTFSPLANCAACPFAQTKPPIIWPEFCNIAQMGSSVDMATVSLATQASDRFVSDTCNIPVVADYNINVHGIPDVAIGSVDSYLKTHIQEGRMEYVNDSLYSDQKDQVPIYVYRPGKYEDVSYSETSTASGLITTFNKGIHYQSGTNLL